MITSTSWRLVIFACSINIFFAISNLFLPQSFMLEICRADEQIAVRKLNVDFLPESGCPVVVIAARTELDLDPFGAPSDARTYVDYRNVSNKPIVAVKFRIRFYDLEGKDHGTFHAPDARAVEAGGQGSQKWRTERVYPRTAAVKMRTLEVRFADGSTWQSVKMPEIVQPTDIDKPAQPSLPTGQMPAPGSAPAGTLPDGDFAGSPAQSASPDNANSNVNSQK